MEKSYLPWDLATNNEFTERILPKWIRQGVNSWIWLTSYPCNEIHQPDFPEMENELWEMSQATLRDKEFEQDWYELETWEGL